MLEIIFKIPLEEYSEKDLLKLLNENTANKFTEDNIIQEDMKNDDNDVPFEMYVVVCYEDFNTEDNIISNLLKVSRLLSCKIRMKYENEYTHLNVAEFEDGDIISNTKIEYRI